MLSTLFDIDIDNKQRPGFNLKAVGDKPVILSKAYFLFKNGDVKLQSAFDKALREIKADGTLEAIKKRVFDNFLESL